MKLFLFIFLTTGLLFSCKKESDKKYCWQAFSPTGGDVPGLVVCDKTQSEVESAYPQYWFYKATEPKYCWQIKTVQGQTYYGANIPLSMTEKLKARDGSTFIKIDCNSFCYCQWIEKHKSKITGFFTPNTVVTETLLSSDSCNKLYVGRVIIVRETADSIITRELQSKQP